MTGGQCTEISGQTDNVRTGRKTWAVGLEGEQTDDVHSTSYVCRLSGFTAYVGHPAIPCATSMVILWISC